MINGKMQLRPRYGEVDQMGYVYHANYLSFCHEARTELLRQYGINDSNLEENDVMIPVISFSIAYKKPARYDEILTIATAIRNFPKIRLSFDFEIRNTKNELICTAASTVVFVNKTSRQPVRLPHFVEDALRPAFV